MVYKTNESIIVIQAEATNPNNTGVVFWSHDRGTAKLRMQLVRKNEIPQSLPEGTTVPIRLMFRSATAEGGYGKHDYLATIEDRVNGIVSIVLEDNILGYVGTVEGSVYIDFPNDRSLDTAGRFTFSIKRSPIDDSTPELEDYYFNGFSQTIDKIEKILADGKQEIEQKIAESETQIDAKLKDTNDKITKANQDVATLNTNIDKANARIDQTNQQIGDLGQLKKMYSNSIDFGNYDYSGNPNLMANINADSFSRGRGALSVVDDGDEVVVTLDPTNKLEIYKEKSQPALVVGETYTMSVEIMLEDDFAGDPSTIGLRYFKLPDWTPALTTYSTLTNTKGIWQKLTVTSTMTTAIDKAESWHTVLYNKDANNHLSGRLRLRHVKLEKSTTATPCQPNLLDAPYYLSKVALGENLIKPESQQPVTNSNYLINTYNIKPMVKGKKYTITLEGTKPATRVFRPFFTRATGDAWEVGDLQPVEGLTNVWSKTFTAADDSHPTTPQVQIYQVPNTSVGQCTIKWLKLEEGNTRTPNISQFKYFGEGLKDSDNPNDYSWDITPEYAEKSLNNTVSLTEPQTVLGLKNFSDGIQIAGDHVVSENEHVVYTLDASNSKSFSDGYATFIKHGKIVIANGTVKFKKAYAYGVPLDDEVPDEFIARGVNGMIVGSSGSSNSAKTIYVRQDYKSIMTNSEFAINEWFTFNGVYWVGEE
ncbi:BppU family phage baseplate upper protein [Enterococcus durans]|uniref:BppU family phage baseplate upper protein n=1 Tax=Enterococcus durans TaxID=53345 RepID=UPI001C8BDCC7|nr:BppU family phage baseplate upper protein [Enterococcus durans]MBX9040555.1 BppU family phage baseplate upper protein [Enterococcus durans]MBX9077263.1 BppU family phage baseplate upper protein [Enterococcus durans]